MLKLSMNVENRRRNVLCLGAHCDDIEIGCGGSLLEMIGGESEISITWIIFCADKTRKEEAKRSFGLFMDPVKEKRIEIKDGRDGFLPYYGKEVKEQFEELKLEVNPDIIFTHQRNDLHQDHRLISELTWNTFRDHLILEYEIPKYDGDWGNPNVFIEIGCETSRRKIKTIMDAYRSQVPKHWFTEDTFLSHMRLRGMESNSYSGMAEGFHCRKIVLE